MSRDEHLHYKPNIALMSFSTPPCSFHPLCPNANPGTPCCMMSHHAWEHSMTTTSFYVFSHCSKGLDMVSNNFLSSISYTEFSTSLAKQTVPLLPPVSNLPKLKATNHIIFTSKICSNVNQIQRISILISMFPSSKVSSLLIRMNFALSQKHQTSIGI